MKFLGYLLGFIMGGFGMMMLLAALRINEVDSRRAQWDPGQIIWLGVFPTKHPTKAEAQEWCERMGGETVIADSGPPMPIGDVRIQTNVFTCFAEVGNG